MRISVCHSDSYPALHRLEHVCKKASAGTLAEQGVKGMVCHGAMSCALRRGGQGKLQMIATRDISKGEEVVNNYGELSQVCVR